MALLLCQSRHPRAEYRMAYGSPWPWEWTNLLGQGDEQALRNDADDGQHRHTECGGTRHVWQAARSSLAAELLDLAHSCGSLGGLQRSVIVPLELELAARAETVHWRPDEWVVAVEGVLSQKRRALLDAIRPESCSPNQQRRQRAPSADDDGSTRGRP